MTEKRTQKTPRSLPWRLLPSLALVALLVAVGPTAWPDDTDLLRFDTAQPYVFVLLDSSASMGLSMAGDDVWTPGGADSPDSRLYQAKQALFNTFRNVSDVNFGFATFNQDHVRVVTKHWIYYHEETLPDSWPLRFPLPDASDGVVADGGPLDDPSYIDSQTVADGSMLTQAVAIYPVDEDGNVVTTLPTDADGNTVYPPTDHRVTEIDGHVLTFGSPFVDGSGDSVRRAGTCSDPLDLSDGADAARVQSLSIDGNVLDVGGPTGFWVTPSGTGSASTYFLTVKRPSNRTLDDGTTEPNKAIGRDGMTIDFELYEVSDCSAGEPDTSSGSPDHSLSLRMRLDPYLNATFYVNGVAEEDGDPNVWSHQDAFSAADYSTSHPFTGKGWEGNYDSCALSGDSDFNDTVESFNDQDRFYSPETVFPGDACVDTSTALAAVRPVEDTVYVGTTRPLDHGDMIPFNWDNTWRTRFLQRLAPGWSLGEPNPDFRTASYFADDAVDPDSTVDGDEYLPLVNTSERPTLALDRSPLARAINDVRCWYLGSNGQGGSSKCASNAFFDQGWEEVACLNDSRYRCRKPFLILISDGEDSVNTGGGGENASADIGNLESHSGVRTWALGLGNGCDSNQELHSLVRQGGGQCISVETGGQLRQTLEAILGEIRTETRSFASAAVPTVQASVEQKIFLTNFTPLNDSGVWDGHVLSFLKPLPVSADGKPNTDLLCKDLAPGDANNPVQGCHLWDAGLILATDQYPGDPATTDVLDEADGDKRRVFYAQRGTQPGEWVTRRHLLEQAALGSETQEQRFDLWRGLGVGFNTNEPTPVDGDPHPNKTAWDTAEGILDYTLVRKTGTVDEPDGTTRTVSFVLGDIFHSTPQVIGTPSNVFYFARDFQSDLNADGATCDAETLANRDRGYRCFFRRQERRRKMLIVGSNDGQLHFFDGGIFRSRGQDYYSEEDLSITGADIPVADQVANGSFDNGTGRELFSYVPRQVLPILTAQESFRSTHEFSVDGNVTVADVYIDPLRQGTEFPVAADRQWRTALIGSLRRGGQGYYALDITQPDPVEQVEGSDLYVPANHDTGNNNPSTPDFLPACTVTDANGAPSTSGCGPIPFPAPLWEFTDTLYNPDDGVWYLVDEDEAYYDDDDVPDPGAAIFDITAPESDPSVGEHDLGDSWSTPNVGVIRVCAVDGSSCGAGGDDADVEDRFVAVFGGGMDEESKNSPTSEKRGNWLYMVDIETGEAIYKQRLQGPAPAEPAAVDTDGDGYLDRIYIGTLAGYMYRADIGPDSTGDVPALEMTSVTAIHPDSGNSATYTADVPRIPRDEWVPRILFDANGNPTSTGAVAPGSRPIYFRPSVIFRAGSGNFALAFGTGDREDLWSLGDSTLRQRFFMFVDSVDNVNTLLSPFDESTLTQITAATESTTGTPVNQGGNFLTTTGGWYMVLGPYERVITEPFALSGIVVFSSYVPMTILDPASDDSTTEDPEERVCGAKIENDNNQPTCSLGGNSHVFVVNATNGDGLITDAGVQARWMEVKDFVTNPFTESGQTKKVRSDDTLGDDADELSSDLRQIMESLKDLFPPQCKFANYRVDIKTIASDTSLQFIAPVPVCIIEHNWKEY